MSTKYAKASLFVAGFASITLALMTALGGTTPTAYAASTERMPQVIDTPTNPPPAPPTPTAEIPLTPVPGVTPVPGGGEQPHFAEPYVFKSADVAQVKPGETINFTIIVGNRGDVDAVNVQVRDTLPDYLDLVSVTATTGTVTTNGRSFLVDIGTVRVGELITIRVAATGNSSMKAGSCYNMAVLNTTSGGNNPNNDSSTVTYVCGEVVNPPTGGDNNSGLVVVLLAAGLLMIGASFVISGRKSTPQAGA